MSERRASRYLWMRVWNMSVSRKWTLRSGNLQRQKSTTADKYKSTVRVERNISTWCGSGALSSSFFFGTTCCLMSRQHMNNITLPHVASVSLEFFLPSHYNIIWPSPSNRQHLSCDDCLYVRKENNQKCSVLYCVWQWCTTICTHMWTVLKFALRYRFRFCVFA